MKINTKRCVNEKSEASAEESNARGGMMSKIEGHPQSSIPALADRSPLLKGALRSRPSPAGDRGERAVVLRRAPPREGSNSPSSSPVPVKNATWQGFKPGTAVLAGAQSGDSPKI
jgi:hypothetical protein